VKALVGGNARTATYGVCRCLHYDIIEFAPIALATDAEPSIRGTDLAEAGAGKSTALWIALAAVNGDY